jgi:hypothetical protein
MPAARFRYVQSRLQARHGRRPSDGDWRLLEATEDLGGYLQAARRTCYEGWVQHLAADADFHQVESAFRQDWVAYCREVGHWLPDDWVPAVEWVATIVYLPMIVHLAREEPAWRWMRDDDVLAEFAVQDPVVRRQALGLSDFRSLAVAIAEGAEPLATWLDIWLDRSPAGAERERLAALASELVRHLAPSAAAGETTPAQRRIPLQQALNRLFRRWSGSVGAVFCHLGLIALDVERLRAGLILRALLPRAAGRPQWA